MREGIDCLAERDTVVEREKPEYESIRSTTNSVQAANKLGQTGRGAVGTIIDEMRKEPKRACMVA